MSSPHLLHPSSYSLPHLSFPSSTPFYSPSSQTVELERNVWKLKEDNQRLTVRLMEIDGKSAQFSRRSGDGGSEENCVRSGGNSDVDFRRQTNLRQTYHFCECHLPLLMHCHPPQFPKIFPSLIWCPHQIFTPISAENI